MSRPTTNDPETLALQALAATLTDERRALRFLELTGIAVDDLRSRAADADTLAALFGFLEAYEPDLLAVAGELGVPPQELVAAGQALAR